MKLCGSFYLNNNFFPKNHYFFVLFVLLVFYMKINELTIFPLVKCCHSLSQFDWKLFAPFFKFCHKSYTFVTYSRMIVIIMSCHNHILIYIIYNQYITLNYRESWQQRQVRQAKYILLRRIYFINELFPNRVGSEAVINSLPNFFDEWTCNNR